LHNLLQSTESGQIPVLRNLTELNDMAAAEMNYHVFMFSRRRRQLRHHHDHLNRVLSGTVVLVTKTVIVSVFHARSFASNDIIYIYIYVDVVVVCEL
jgi:hypothetical protein